MVHVSLKSTLLDYLGDWLFTNYLNENSSPVSANEDKGRAKFNFTTFCISGKEPLEVMTTLFSQSLKGRIFDGIYSIGFEGETTFNHHPSLLSIYLASIGEAYVAVGNPATPMYKKTVELCCRMKKARKIQFMGTSPYGGIPKLRDVFSRVEVLNIEARFVAPGLQNGFPVLTSLTTYGSVAEILRLFENVSHFPLLKNLTLSITGNVNEFLTKFVHDRFPELAVVRVHANHYSDDVYENVAGVSAFCDLIPSLHSAEFTVIQVGVPFIDDPEFYLRLRNTFIDNPCNATLKIQLQHTPKPTFGETLNASQIERFLLPLEYVINPDYSGFYTVIVGRNIELQHHVLVELPVLNRRRK